MSRSKGRTHSNPTDKGAKDYPPIHSKGQGFVSPLLSPVEHPNIGYEVDTDIFLDDAPNPMGFPVNANSKKGR